ncbi:hypothetical protein JQC92_06555 [Shewanella sp. 202IG2-18]|uniref:hypothetical protein n=1 Tax=Parashewanella hymeniacidonis TaxID=2807618 RepID=UPI00196103F4|nr:hypothetical protein [Parashewanella hymeniacidonis]MBM7071702.1 hypothetical protein [Parashewanella hymeniacidonis]
MSLAASSTREPQTTPEQQSYSFDEDEWVIPDESKPVCAGGLLCQYELEPKFSALSKQPPEFRHHKNLYGTPKEQFAKFNALMADENIPLKVKEAAVKQINATMGAPTRLYRAIQTLNCENEKCTESFIEVKKSLVIELAEKYVDSRDDIKADKKEYVAQLVRFAASDFGYEPEQQSPEQQSRNGFVRCSQLGHVSYADAEGFLKLADAYLSPTRIMNKTAAKGVSRVAIAWGSKLVERAPEGFRWGSKKYNVQVMPWNQYTSIQQECIPQLDVSSMHPHIYIPMCEAAISQCKSTEDVCKLALRVLPKFNAQQSGHETYQILEMAFKNKAQQLSKDQAHSESFTPYIEGESFKEHQLLTLCSILPASEQKALLDVVVKARSLPISALCLFKHQTLLSLPQDVLKKIPWEEIKPMLSMAVKRGWLDLIQHCNLQNRVEHEVKEIAFEAVEKNNTTILGYLLTLLGDTACSVTSDYPVQSIGNARESRTLFAHACHIQQFDVVRFLMRNHDIDVKQVNVVRSQTLVGPMVSSIQSESILIFNRALSDGNEQLVKELLSNFTPSELRKLRDPEGKTSMLQWACKKGHLYLVKFILPIGSDVDGLDTQSLERASKSNVKTYMQKVTSSNTAVENNVNPEAQAKKDKNRTLFFKKARFKEAVADGNIDEIDRWVKADVRSFSVPEVRGLFQLALQDRKGETLVKLINLFETEESKSILMSDVFLISIAKLEDVELIKNALSEIEKTTNSTGDKLKELTVNVWQQAFQFNNKLALGYIEKTYSQFSGAYIIDVAEASSTPSILKTNSKPRSAGIEMTPFNKES